MNAAKPANSPAGDIDLAGPAATAALGEAIAARLQPGDVVALSGPLGAGKTSLARGVLQGLGFADDVASPSYPLVIAYDPPETRLSLLHVDLYRAEDAREADELGLDEAIETSALLIEWPERLGQRLWPHALRLTLDFAGDARRLTAYVPPGWARRWPAILEEWSAVKKLPVHGSAFLAAAGWGDARVDSIEGDASFRRYFRLARGEDRALLMDAPPPHEDPRPFLAVADHLAAIGFRAPRILARDVEAGVLLIEDFGDDRMREHVDAAPERADTIYTDAVDLLAALRRHPAPGFLAPYDRAVLHREVDIFTEYYAPAVDVRIDATAWRTAWDMVFDALPDEPPVTVLRDYHAENIMLLGEGAGAEDPVSRLGLIDFQDALAGHPAYDLVSLLQDARRTVPPELEARMRAHYAARTGLARDPAALASFDRVYAILGAQRNTKILGIFARLWRRDGKPRYLAFMPRVWAYLERDLADPALAPVAALFAERVPREARAARWEEGALNSDPSNVSPSNPGLSNTASLNAGEAA